MTIKFKIFIRIQIKKSERSSQRQRARNLLLNSESNCALFAWEERLPQSIRFTTIPSAASVCLRKLVFGLGLLLDHAVSRSLRL